MRGRLPALLPAAAIALAAFLSPVTASAQERAASPVDDVLDRMTGDVNDLRYPEALRRGRAFAGTEDALTLAQRVRWRLLMAAAFYPDDERRHQHPDSALRHLRALIRIAPDARYAPEMRWRGLDSLLQLARERTLGAVVRGPLTQRVAGSAAPGTVEVIASRPVRFSLAVRERATGRVTQRDSATGARAAMRLAAHDDRRVLLAPGEYDLVLTAHDVDDETDSVVTRHLMTVEGQLPLLEPEPPLPAGALRPERLAPSRTPLIAKAAVFSGLTFGLATLARSDGALRDRFPTDGRAYLVGGAMIAGTAAIILRQRSRPVPANIAANAAARAEHDRRIAQVIDANRARLAGYGVSVRIAAEPQ